MKLEFQEEILKYFCQQREAKPYIEIFDADLFETIYHATAFDVLKEFLKNYKTLPSMADMLDYFRRRLKAQKGEKVAQQVVDMVEAEIRKAYDPFAGNILYIKAVITEEYQNKLMTKLFKDQAQKLKDKEPDALATIFKKVKDIKRLSDTDIAQQEKNRGKYLLKDYKANDYDLAVGKPCYLKGINKMRGTGGFCAPELTLFMMPPKGFKTGTCLNIAMGYMRDGEKCYYADTENGHNKLNARMKQCMAELTFGELVSGEHNEVLQQIVDKMKMRGGDFVADFFPAHSMDMNDVDAELERRKEEDGFIPTQIYFDNLDNFKPIDKSIKEKRHQITAVYFDAIKLLNKWDCAGFSPSQVNRNAVNKPILDMTAFAEDFMKAANCHAAFAMCQDGVEKIAWIARIVPVVQREGVDQDSGAVCYVELDKARMQIKEITHAQWKERYEKAKPEFEKLKGVTVGKAPRNTISDTMVKTKTARGVKRLSDDTN